MIRKRIILATVLVMLMTTVLPAATIRWLGTATAVAQVDTFTPANVEVDDIFTLTVTGLDGTTHVINFTATAATVANVTAGITAAWNASTNSLCTPITAADNTTNMTLTADVAGDAFSVLSSETDGGGTDDQTFTRAATTASAGPKHWDTAANWSGGAVPGGAGGQDVFVEDFSGDILYGLDQSGITTLDSLNFGRSFTGKLGPNGSSGIAAAYLQIKATAINIGRHFGPGSPAGSGRLKIDCVDVASTITVDYTATAADTGKPAVRLLTNSTTANLYVNKGNVGLAAEAGETSTLGTVRVGFLTNVSSDADLYLGDGVTFGGTNTLDISGGETSLRSAVTTVTVTGGTLTKTNAGAITTLNTSGGTVTTWDTGTIGTVNAFGGTFNSNSTGTITALTIKTGGTVDFTKSPAARTVTTPKLDAGGVLKYDPDIITFTNKLDSDNKVTLTAS